MIEIVSDYKCAIRKTEKQMVDSTLEKNFKENINKNVI